MGLTIGDDPFGPNAQGEFNFRRDGPSRVLYFAPCPRRIRVRLGDETIADSRNAKLLHETGLLPLYYFPMDDVRMERLEESRYHTHCPYKGDARYWSVRVGDRFARDAAWSYPQPLDGAPDLSQYIAFYWHSMDEWLEEDEPVYGHPRDPFTRIDVRQSSRQVRVFVHGELVAETHRPRMLFETGLPPRYYIPLDDIHTDKLHDSDTTTYCPYKGTATYASIETREGRAPDVAWAYEAPFPEAQQVQGCRCFLGRGVQTEVDGRVLDD